MIQFQFKDEELQKFYNNFLRAEHPKTRLKNFALYLKCMGIPHLRICELSRITEPTLVSYLKDFRLGGFERFEELKWQGQKSELNKYIELIRVEFDANPPKSVNDAKNRIEKMTGIKRGPTQIQYFLKTKLNYRYLKTGSLPGNGKDDDIEKELEREDFKKNNSNHYWCKQEKTKK